LGLWLIPKRAQTLSFIGKNQHVQYGGAICILERATFLERASFNSTVTIVWALIFEALSDMMI
jgi:hypothetical protein